MSSISNSSHNDLVPPPQPINTVKFLQQYAKSAVAGGAIGLLSSIPVSIVAFPICLQAGCVMGVTGGIVVNTAYAFASRVEGLTIRAKLIALFSLFCFHSMSSFLICKTASVAISFKASVLFLPATVGVMILGVVFVALGKMVLSGSKGIKDIVMETPR